MDEQEREIEWPDPREDPEEEPSHPGARGDESDEGWWERWLAENPEERIATEEERHGADA
jgi:hypothetical protein